MCKTARVCVVLVVRLCSFFVPQNGREGAFCKEAQICTLIYQKTVNTPWQVYVFISRKVLQILNPFPLVLCTGEGRGKGRIEGCNSICLTLVCCRCWLCVFVSARIRNHPRPRNLTCTSAHACLRMCPIFMYVDVRVLTVTLLILHKQFNYNCLVYLDHVNVFK